MLRLQCRRLRLRGVEVGGDVNYGMSEARANEFLDDDESSFHFSFPHLLQ